MDFKQLDSGLIVPYYFTRKRRRPIAFDFFCGCGGFGLGLIQAGFEIVGANEFDGSAALTYMTNLGSYPINIHYIILGDTIHTLYFGKVCMLHQFQML